MRRPEWTESVAVGSEAFVSGVLESMKSQRTSRHVKDAGHHYELREPAVAYNAHYGPEMDRLRPKSTYFWAKNDGKSEG